MSTTTFTLLPSGGGLYAEWPYGGDLANWQVVSDFSDATEVTGTLVGQRDLHEVADLEPRGIDSISEVVVILRARVTNTGTPAANRIAPIWQLGDTLVQGTTITTLTDTYTNIRQTATRPGGGTWSVADINSLYVGYQLIARTAGANVTVSECALEVTVVGDIPNTPTADAVTAVTQSTTLTAKVSVVDEAVTVHGE